MKKKYFILQNLMLSLLAGFSGTSVFNFSFQQGRLPLLKPGPTAYSFFDDLVLGKSRVCTMTKSSIVLIKCCEIFSIDIYRVVSAILTGYQAFPTLAPQTQQKENLCILLNEILEKMSFLQKSVSESKASLMLHVCTTQKIWQNQTSGQAE